MEFTTGSLASWKRTINEKQMAEKAFVTSTIGGQRLSRALVLRQFFHRAEKIVGLWQDGIF
jgi:hypothetical protein